MEYLTQLMDMCIKNGGDLFFVQVASPEFTDELIELVHKRASLPPNVREKLLQCVQDWRYLAQTRPDKLGHLVSSVEQLEKDGVSFPPPDPNAVSAAQAFVETPVIPEWTDNDVCTRCRSEFGAFLRKHHCRNCGRVFCYKCSDQSMPLPWFSIEEKVRVCEGCAKRRAPPPDSRPPAAPKPVHFNQEDEDLKRAIELSLREQTQKGGFASTVHKDRMAEGTDADDDPDLAAAIAASLRDVVEQPVTESQPLPSAATDPPSHVPYLPQVAAQPRSPLELDAIDRDHVLTFSQTVLDPYAPWKRVVPSSGVPRPVQNMHDKAASSRIKVVHHLDQGQRRLRELSSLHDMLSDAVRVYDRLLDGHFEQDARGNRSVAPATLPQREGAKSIYAIDAHPSAPSHPSARVHDAAGASVTSAPAMSSTSAMPSVPFMPSVPTAPLLPLVQTSFTPNTPSEAPTAQLEPEALLIEL